MIRSIKMLMLALVAVFAVNAGAASVASAQSGQGELTSDGPVKLTGVDEEGTSKLTAFGLTAECDGHYHAGEKDKTEPPGSKTVHPFVTKSLTTLTIAPTYTPCFGVLNGMKFPITITMNGCDYLLHIGTTVVPGQWPVTVDVVCPTGKEIEIHVYQTSAHATTICTVKVKGQAGLAGGIATNLETAGGQWDVTLKGPIKGIHLTKTGVLCGGTATTNEGQLDTTAIYSGTNEEEGPTDLTITDS